MADFFKPRNQQKKRNSELDKEKESERKEKYEKNQRSREPLQKWLTDYKWLRFEETDQIYEGDLAEVAQKRLRSLRLKRSKDAPHNELINKLMICVDCREKHFADNRSINRETFVPSVEEFEINAFIFGAISYRIESLRKHSENKTHYLAITRSKNIEKEQSNQLSDGQRCKVALNEIEKKHLHFLFINVYGILKKGKPFSDYEFLIKLDKAKNVDIGKTYLNTNSGIKFAKAIDNCHMKKFIQEFNQTNFFSIILDESTDKNKMEQCVLYLRYSLRGSVQTKFLSIDNVSRPNAEQLTNLILKLLKEGLNWEPPNEDEVLEEVFEIEEDSDSEVVVGDRKGDQAVVAFYRERDTNDDDKEFKELSCYEDSSLREHDFLESDEDENGEDINLDVLELRNPLIASDNNNKKDLPLMIGITTDGASVLTGKKTGVQKRIKDICNKNLTASHCISHRLQLAIKDSLQEKEATFRRLFAFLQTLFSFHSKSTVITAAYRNALKALNIRGKSSVIRVDGTRWISHVVNSLENLFNGIEAHKEVLSTVIKEREYSSIQKAKAKHLLANLDDDYFMSFSLYMLDVCRAMSLFSKITQKKNVPISEIQIALNQAITQIQRFIDNPDSGYYWNKLKSYKIKEDKICTKKQRIDIAKSIQSSVAKRCNSFPTIFECSTNLLNTPGWTKDTFFIYENGKFEQTKIFDDIVSEICKDRKIETQLRSKDVDIGAIPYEWTDLKNRMCLWVARGNFPPKSWKDIGDQTAAEFDNLFALVDFLLSLSLSSADAERGFSQMKNLKTDKRTSLGNNLLTLQLRVVLEGVEIAQFDPSEAIECWASYSSHGDSSANVRAKRPNFMDSQAVSTSFGPKKKKVEPMPIFID